MSETTVERVAKAIYEGRNGAGCIPWSKRDRAHKVPYLADAAVAIAALSDDDPAKVFWQDWAARRLEISRMQWLRAAKRALAGDMRDLQLRVELTEAPPVQIVLSDAARTEEEPRP